ncbi:hypothetical protein [Oculatella sp. LEGE 06141]|uniref:hypothetical protein n=1 Tax=Oculatella sp. LEGE 06141 TaxID=1828648 RepID=UPI00187E6A63|nr:hypothetical protein [Oculatella sp. LEGE 06141]
MAQRLKRWESPRREGRNNKGRGGSARHRQKQKQLKALRLKLKQQPDAPIAEKAAPDQKRGEHNALPFFVLITSEIKLAS